MSQELVIFKGTKEGIYIYIKEGNFRLIKKELDMKLKKSGSFFKGGKIIDFKGKKLSKIEENELREMIHNKYQLELAQMGEKEKSEKQGYFEGIDEGKTKFIKTTLRSGQIIRYDGNIVIFGDVNPGAVILATGNIIVLGTLRGIAHAGYDGNKKALVAAFNLQPTQLRIANVIARCPDEDVVLPKWPEIAKIEKGEVLIETYLPKNNKKRR